MAVGLGRLQISEIFGPTVQGEGALIGRPTVFVRTGGCDFRCAWCDTLFAVLPEYRDSWRSMSEPQILGEVDRLAGGKPILVTLSGGNPALQPLAELIRQGRERGHDFALETQGSVARDWFRQLDWLVLSPKPPSSGMEIDWEALAECVSAAGRSTATVLKIVVFDQADYDCARAVAARHPELPVILQVGNGDPPTPAGEGAPNEEALKARFRWLVERVAADRWYSARVLPQLHLWAWGNARGV